MTSTSVTWVFNKAVLFSCSYILYTSHICVEWIHNPLANIIAKLQLIHDYLEFEVLTAVVMSFILWDIVPCGLLKVSLRFCWMYRLHLQGWRVSQARKKPEGDMFLLNTGSFQWATRRYIPENGILNAYLFFTLFKCRIIYYLREVIIGRCTEIADCWKRCNHTLLRTFWLQVWFHNNDFQCFFNFKGDYRSSLCWSVGRLVYSYRYHEK
jgi:hypothetical protein